MTYTVYFDSSVLDRDVFDNARDNNQLITYIAIFDTDSLTIEFESSREFEKEKFLNYLNAKKNKTFRDYYHAWKYNE